MPDETVNATDLIIRIGQALWGERWQSELARAVRVSRDTVQDWRQGRTTPRIGVFRDLVAVSRERMSEIESAHHQLEQFIKNDRNT